MKGVVRWPDLLDTLYTLSEGNPSPRFHYRMFA